MKAVQTKSGSVLLITLLVVSLLMVLVVSLSVYVRLELREVNERQLLLQARQNAKLSMHLALNKLQTAAGPDQRVTARADVLGGSVSPEATHWTGVWVNDLAGGVQANPVWLVSGTGSTPLSGAGGSSMELFPAVNSDAAVEVPLEDLTDNNGDRTGEIAYWVSDEASKVSFAARRDSIELYEDAALNGLRRITEFQSDFGVQMDTLFTNPEVRLTDSAFFREMERALSAGGLELGRDANLNTLVPRQSDLPLHDLTFSALGVLENTVDGGLKRNLSDLTYRDGFLATDQTALFLGPKGSSLPVESGTPTVSEGEPWFSPRPIITEAVLYVGLFHTWSDAKVRIRYHVQAEFLNPYTFPLEFPADNSGSYDRGLVLVFEGLPEITVEDLSGTGPTLVDDLDAFMYQNSNPTSWRRYINSWFEIEPQGSPNIPILLPGEVFQVMEPNPATQARGLARDFTTTRWSGSSSTRPANNAQIRITADHPAGGVTLYAVPYDSPFADYRDRPVVTSIENVPFDDFSVTKVFNTGPNPFSRSTSSSYVISDYNFAYHFRFWSDDTDPGSVRDLMTGANFHDPFFDANGSFEDLQGANRSNADVLDPISSYPPDIVADTLNLFSGLDLYSDGTARSHGQDYREHFLVDVPNNDTLSVGRLSHLNILGRRPRMIGSPWGENYNTAFDRYYFSPKVTSPSTGDLVVAHPAITDLDPSDDAASSDDAATEMVQGAFNINSTSADAWEAVLAAPIITPTADDEIGSGDQIRPGAFFRLPGFQANGSGFYITHDPENTPAPPNDIRTPDLAFAQGVRILAEDEGREQIRQMATSIVTQIRNRGEPFPDIASFVNSGILQTAIDEVNSDTAAPDPEINEDVVEFSNVYLTQNDVLTKLAPHIVPRSDTFVIRAYGNVRGAGSVDAVSRATCEVVVQRLPQKIDDSDPMTPSDRITNLRQFRIVSFRWLTDEDA